MITAVIFAAHLIFMLIIFTKKWQQEDLSQGLLNLALIILLFTVGWAITGMIAKALMDQKGFGIYYDRDAFSLSLLVVIEFLFYRSYYSSFFKKEESTQR